MKKLIFLLTLTLFFSVCSQVFAYTPGEISIDIDLTDPVSLYNATSSNNTLSIQSGGEAVYQFYAPFDTQTIALTTNANSSTLTMILDDNTDTLNLKTTTNHTLKQVLKRGEHQLTLIANDNITISKITFTKINRDQGTSTHNYGTTPDLTAFESAIQTAYIFSPNSPIMLVNGAKRYVNNDDAREVPYIENGELYLPLHSFARTFGYYYEEKDNQMVLMKENLVFLLKDGVLTKQVNYNEPDSVGNIIKTINGKKYIPINYFAEIDGKTVTIKDGFYIVEYPSNTKAIIKDVIFNELKHKYTAYYLEAANTKTYYVSGSSATDNGDGSEDNPFKTISEAAEIAKAGDTVIIEEGIYREILSPKNNGTASLPITFKAKEGDKVVISATEKLGAPIGKEGDMLIYDTIGDLSDGNFDFIGRNQIFYNNANLVAARHPNTDTVQVISPKKEGLSPEWPTRGNILLSEDDKYVAVSTTDLEHETDYWKGGTFVALKGSGWCLEMAKIEGSEPGKLYLRDGSIQWWHPKNSHTDDYGYITDCKNAIDIPGEWAIENNKLYIIPPQGETAETLQLEQKARQTVVDIADKKFIRIEGIDTFGGGAKLNESEMCMMRDGTYQYLSHYTYSKDQREGFIDKRDPLNSNGSPQRGEQGFYIGGSDNIIINNKFEYSASSAIYTVGLHGYFEDNYIHDCGYMSSYVGGFFFGTKGWESPDTPRGGNLVLHNTIVNAGRQVYGTATYESWYSGSNPTIPVTLPEEVAYNYFADGSMAARDTGTLYVHGVLQGTDRKWTAHHHNIVENSWSYKSTMNAGMYYDGYSAMVECYDNIILSNRDDIPYNSGIFQQYVPSAPSLTDKWNNKVLGYIEGGKDALTVDDYPDAKIFRSGCAMLAEDMTPYLNSINIERNQILAKNGTVSSGAKIEDGLFKPSNPGDYICFENVDFSEGQNVINLYGTGDKYNTNEELTIIVGNNLTDYYAKQKIKVNATSSYDWAKINLQANLFGHIPKGKTNLYVISNNAKSFALERVTLSYQESEYSNVSTGIYAAEGKVISGKIHTSTQSPVGETYPYMMDTWGSVLLYEDVEIREPCDTLFTRIASAGDHAGQLFYLRISDPEGTVVGEARETNGSWDDFSLNQFKLNQTIQPGTYDFYITFEEPEKSSNFFWFGLGVLNILKTDNYIEKSPGISVVTSTIRAFNNQTTIKEFKMTKNNDYITYNADLGNNPSETFIVLDLRVRKEGNITISALDGTEIASFNVAPRTNEENKTNYNDITYISIGKKLNESAKNLAGHQTIKVTFNGEADFCRLNNISFPTANNYLTENSADLCHSWTAENKNGMLGRFDNSQKYASWVIDFGEENTGVKEAEISIASSANYHNELIQVRLDSPDGEIIAEHMLDMQGKTDWTQTYYVTAPLTKEISGVHLIFVTNSPNPGYTPTNNSAADVFSLKFNNKGDIATYANIQSKYFHPKTSTNAAYYDEELFMQTTVVFDASKTDAEEVLRITAFYDENDQLVKEEISKHPVTDGLNVLKTNPNYENLPEGTYKIKGFIWNAENLKPLNLSEEFIGNIIIE